MKYMCISGNILAKADSQLQGINVVNMNNSTETENFWSEVKEIRDTSAENPFSNVLGELRYYQTPMLMYGTFSVHLLM